MSTPLAIRPTIACRVFSMVKTVRKQVRLAFKLAARSLRIAESYRNAQKVGDLKTTPSLTSQFTANGRGIWH